MVKGKGIIYAGHDCLQKLSTKFYILKHDVLNYKIRKNSYLNWNFFVQHRKSTIELIEKLF